jgi:hypothetical protein
MKSLVEYIKDYENADSATGNEKKALASEYGTGNKIKDIQKAILLKMRDERHNRKEYTNDDLIYFHRLDFPDRDREKYYAEEPIEFIRFVADKYLEDLKKRKLDKYIGLKSFGGGYSFSASQKYMIKRYQAILSYLNENDKTDDEKIQAKADKERLENIMELAINKLHEQLKDFKKQLMEQVKKQSNNRYDEAPQKLEKLKKSVEKYDNMEYRELMQGNNYKNREKLKHAIAQLNAILRMSKSDFIKKNLEAAEDQYNSDVKTMADKIHDKGLNIEAIECTNVHQDPKVIEMVITDGVKKLYCRSIIAAEYSDKMVAHFRFIITERK